MEAASARKLFAGPCAFLLAAAAPDQFPRGKTPEAAFIGRSNVGKSSLINALAGRKSLARASNTPGRTQQIVFFDLGGRLMLADLPGYGFAKAPRHEKERWAELVRHYLTLRPALRAVCLLIDARRGLLKGDLEMMKLLDDSGTGYRIVLTKADCLPAKEHETRHREIIEALKPHPAAHPEILGTSAEKCTGIDELRTYLAGFARLKK